MTQEAMEKRIADLEENVAALTVRLEGCEFISYWLHDHRHGIPETKQCTAAPFLDKASEHRIEEDIQKAMQGNPGSPGE